MMTLSQKQTNALVDTVQSCIANTVRPVKSVSIEDLPMPTPKSILVTIKFEYGYHVRVMIGPDGNRTEAKE